MSDGVDPQILALLGGDKSSMLGAKVAKTPGSSPISDEFSRILDKQRSQSPADTGRAASAADGGSALPSERQSSAASAAPGTARALAEADATAQERASADGRTAPDTASDVPPGKRAEGSERAENRAGSREDMGKGEGSAAPAAERSATPGLTPDAESAAAVRTQGTEARPVGLAAALPGAASALNTIRSGQREPAQPVTPNGASATPGVVTAMDANAESALASLRTSKELGAPTLDGSRGTATPASAGSVPSVGTTDGSSRGADQAALNPAPVRSAEALDADARPQRRMNAGADGSLRGAVAEDRAPFDTRTTDTARRATENGDARFRAERNAPDRETLMAQRSNVPSTQPGIAREAAASAQPGIAREATASILQQGVRGAGATSASTSGAGANTAPAAAIPVAGDTEAADTADNATLRDTLRRPLDGRGAGDLRGAMEVRVAESDGKPSPRAAAAQAIVEGAMRERPMGGERTAVPEPQSLTAESAAGSAPRADAATATTASATSATAAPLPSASTGTAPSSAPGSASSMERMPEFSLGRSPDDPEFPSEVTTRMKLLLRDGVREARLQLHPAELGRLQVTVTTDGDQARVSFVADSNAARDAIEQSLPRLREMFEQNGMQLAQSDVGERSLAQGEREDSVADDRESNASAAITESDTEPDDPQPASRGPASRIDTYI